MFIKTLVFIFLIYIVLRVMFRTRVVIKNFHYTDNRGNHQHKPEGEVTISSKGDAPRKKANDQLGEYVDYEEV